MRAGSLLLAAWKASRAGAIAVGGLLVLNLALYLALSRYFAPALEELERTYIQKQEQVRHQGPGSGAPRTAGEYVRRSRSDLETFRQAIPPQEDFTELIGEIFGLAGQAGLNIAQVKYDPKLIEKQPLLRYGLDFSVTGDYRQLKKFVFSLEQSPRIVAIDEIALQGVGTVAGQVDLKIRLSTIFRTGAP